MLLEYNKFVEKLNFKFARNTDLPAYRKGDPTRDPNSMRVTNMDNLIKRDLIKSSDGDVSATSDTDTVVFGEEEEYYYPYKDFDKVHTHGSISHAIKHLVEIDPEYVIKLLKKAVEIAKTSDEDIVILNKRGNVTSGDYTDINNLNILNTLDMINDKFVTELRNPASMSKDYYARTETENIILNKVIIPMRDRYMSIANDIDSKSLELKPDTNENMIKFLAIVNNSLKLFYYDFPRGILMIKDMQRDKGKVETMFVLSTNILDWINKNNRIKLFKDVKHNLINYVFRKNKNKK